MRSKIAKGAEYWRNKIDYHSKKIAYAQEQLARMDISYDAPCDPARIDAMRDALIAKVRADLDAWRDQIMTR